MTTQIVSHRTSQTNILRPSTLRKIASLILGRGADLGAVGCDRTVAGTKLDIMMPIGKYPDVRRTVSLDDDVVTRLTEEARRTGLSFKAAVNHFLRLGLMAAQQRKPFVVHPRPLGLPVGLSYDNVEELLERMEGAEHK